MPSTVRINYDRFINTGIVPSTDFENSVMDEILTWADDTFDEDAKISLADLIELYWMCKLEGFEISPIEDVDENFEPIEESDEDAEQPSAQILKFPEN